MKGPGHDFPRTHRLAGPAAPRRGKRSRRPARRPHPVPAVDRRPGAAPRSGRPARLGVHRRLGLATGLRPVRATSPTRRRHKPTDHRRDQRGHHSLGRRRPGRPDSTTPLPPADAMAPELAAAACALDAAIHAWDVAVATGRPSPLTGGLASQLDPAARATAEPLRGFAYAAALPAQPGDDPAAALLRYLGRDPHWTA